jgi:hypothetical protein
MTDQLISFETAKLAKEKGFDIPVNYMYLERYSLGYSKPQILLSCARDDGDSDYNWNSRVGYSAPTQSLLQKWLREVNNFDVQVVRVQWRHHNPYFWEHNDESESYSQSKRGWRTYEEALKAGLQEALKLIP